MATKKEKWLQFFEFLIIGVIMGVIEDVIAILLATDAELNLRIIFIALFVALPFAFFSELVVDHPRFWEFFTKSNRNPFNNHKK